jgi:hypothetical protein
MLPRLYVLALLALCSSHAISQQNGNPALPCFQGLAGDPRFAAIKDKESVLPAKPIRQTPDKK